MGVYGASSAPVCNFLLTLCAVNSYKPLMKDFPITELLTGSEIPQLTAALSHIFTHMKKTSKTANYPIPRCVVVWCRLVAGALLLRCA